MSSDALDPFELRLARASPLNEVDWRFGAILGVSIATHLALALHLSAQPLPPWSEQAELEQTFRHSRALPLPTPPRPLVHVAPPASVKPRGPSRVAPAAPAGERVRRMGMLALLVGHGAGQPGAAVDDVLEQATAMDVGQAMKDAGRVKVASAAELPAAPSAARTGEVAAIGHFGADRAGRVALGEHRDTLVTSTVHEEPLEPAAGLDVEVLSRFLAGRRRAVQLCYERELKHHPSLAGRLVMRLSIAPSGRASQVEVEENALGSDALATCVATLMRAWSFPVHPAEEAALSVPYIFSAGR